MKKLLYIGLPVVVVLIVVGVVLMTRPPRTAQQEESNQTVSDNVPSQATAEKIFPTSTDATKSFDEKLKSAYTKDQDLDGLADEEEKTAGTNPKNPDTDGDGLLDGAEQKKFKTNPLKADSDGDGMKDGMEILRGRDPLKKDVGSVTTTRTVSSTR